MKALLRVVTTTLGVAAFGAVFAANASANCWYSPDQKGPSVHQQRWLLRPGAELTRASFVLVADDDSDDAPIVGLWKVTFVSKNSPGIPDGVVVDAGYVTWHSDGTELMNSGRPPASGNFCMGVWKQIGPSTYKLNHFALSWDPTGTTMVGPANIREEVTLSRSKNSYTGSFTIDQYDQSGTVIAHVEGRVTGQRITVD
jgi:hypothetical protein